MRALRGSLWLVSSLLVACGGADHTNPVAQDMNVVLDEDVASDARFAVVDAENDPVLIEILTQPQHGRLFLNGDSFGYLPAPNYNGADSFRYRARDPLGRSEPATVSLQIRPVNDLPEVGITTFSIPEDDTVTFTVPKSDIDGDATTIEISAPDSQGTLQVVDAAAGTLRFLSETNFNGEFRFTLTVRDASSSQNYGASIRVTPVNDAPVAFNDLVRTTLGAATSILVLSNDQDVDNPPLTLIVQSVTPTPAGQVSIEGTSFVHFAPNPDFLGTTTVTYQVADAAGATSSAQITFEVALPHPVYFLADRDTPGRQELFLYDGVGTYKLNEPLAAGERIIDYKVGAGVLYRTRENFTNHLYLKGLLDMPAARVSVHSVDDYGSSQGANFYLTGNQMWLIGETNPVLHFAAPLPGEGFSRVLDHYLPLTDRFVVGTVQFNPSLGASFLRLVPRNRRLPPETVLTLTAPDLVSQPIMTVYVPNEGLHIAFDGVISGARALYLMPLFGTGSPTQISPAFNVGQAYSAVVASPDGTSFIYGANQVAGPFDAYIAHRSTPGAHTRVNLRTSNSELFVKFVVDGDWSNLYYLLSSTSGNDHRVYRTPLAAPGTGAPLSASVPGTYGAYDLVVNRQGDALLYVTGTTAAGPSRLELITTPSGAASARTLRNAGTVIESLRMANDGTTALCYDRGGTLWLVNLLNGATLAPIYTPPAGTDGVSEVRYREF